MRFNFATLDPRPGLAATETNDKVFSHGPVYGIEVTVPALAKCCTFNLDPQHTGSDAKRTAIEDALIAKLPSEGTTLATVRADLDAVGSMAVLSLRKQGIITRLLDNGSRYCPSCGMGNEGMRGCCMACGYREETWFHSRAFMQRLWQVATADKFARGGYSGPKPLPTTDNPWPEESAAAESSRPLAAIAAAVVDFKVPLADRVTTMEAWLLTGEEPAQYRAKVEKERTDMIRALESGEIQYSTVADGHIAVVDSTHRAATMVGYSLAPVVVARNPAFKLGAGEPHTKFTVCAFEAENADIKSALAELATLEAGWGGSPTIGGSPQGVSSILTTEQVVEVVAKHLR